MERPHHCGPRHQLRVGRRRRLGALKQVEILAPAGRVTPGQQVSGQGQQPVGGIGEQRRVDRAEVRCGRQDRVAQEVGHDPVLDEGERPFGLLRRQVMAGRTPRVTDGLEPLARPQLELLLTGPVPGPQLSAQHLAHQVVVPEARPLIVECHKEQVGRVDPAQQRRNVPPRRHGRARAGGQLAQNGGV